MTALLLREGVEMALKKFIKDDLRYILFSQIFEDLGTPRKKRTSFVILESAVDCFSTSGFQGTTLLMIARKAGVSKSSVLDHFEGIEQIRLSSLKYIRTLYQMYVVENLKNEEDPEQLFIKYYKSCFEWSKQFPKHSSVWISFLHMTTINKDLKELNTQSVRIGLDRLKEIILSGCRQTKFECDDVDQMARSIHYMITGMLLSVNTEVQEGEESANMIDFCLDQLRPKGQTDKRFLG